MREERCIAVFARRRSRQRAALAARVRASRAPRSCAFLSGERLDRNCLWPDLPPAIPLALRAWAPPVLAPLRDLRGRARAPMARGAQGAVSARAFPAQPETPHRGLSDSTAARRRLEVHFVAASGRASAPRVPGPDSVLIQY